MSAFNYVLLKVDILAMDRAEHGGQMYNVMLVVTDLYSHFIYGGAIHESSDSTALADHLINLFTMCGPPGMLSTIVLNDNFLFNKKESLINLLKF